MKCFYHNSDADGRCSAAIVSKFTKVRDKNSFIGCDYNKKRIEYMIDTINIEKDEPIYICDLSFTEENADILFKLNDISSNRLVWCDHHKTSIELSNSISNINDIKGIRSSNKSAAYLTWVYFYGINNIPDVVKYVSDWDTFTFEYGDKPKYLNYGLSHDIWYTYPLSTQWKSLLSNNADADGYSKSSILTNNLISIGEKIYKYVKNENTSYLKSYGYESSICGYKVAVVNKASNSLIFGELYKKYPIVSTFCYDGEKWKYSLYSSDKNGDCEAIAKSFGGGGHRGAAGFTSDECIYKKVGELNFTNNKETKNATRHNT